MKHINISSIPLQELLLEACQCFNSELYLKLQAADDIQHQNEINSKIRELELLISVLSEILKNNYNA